MKYISNTCLVLLSVRLIDMLNCDVNYYNSLVIIYKCDDQEVMSLST